MTFWIMESVRGFFQSNRTLSVDFRKDSLKKLKASVRKYQPELENALKMDLGKSETEAYMSEIGLVYSAINFALKKLASWAKPRRAWISLAHFWSEGRIFKEPYGVVLIVSPWNYPVLLTLEPLVAAIAAGNCCVLKLSENSSNTSAVLRRMLNETFPSDFVKIVDEDVTSFKLMLDSCRFDYVFFTGGVEVGRSVMQRVAKFLTPMTLELGGKSPCVVDSTADLRLAARRIVFGKFLNCGQTCVAPDYLIVESCVKDELLRLLKLEIVKMFGENPLQNPDYGKIINERHFERILSLMSEKKAFFGGAYDKKSLKISPTLLVGVSEEDSVMQEEIFGPLLPILIVESVKDAYDFVRNRPKPLAFYLFTKDKKTERLFMDTLHFGGGCVNDTIVHLATDKLPFGGVGDSGFGCYHGHWSFETFSRAKSVLKKTNLVDIPLRYQPYTKLKTMLIKFFIR